ncbi:hypothetical protein RIF29_27114 [Crotalaria pallida]|uniref:Uncharacterized protein n=1 Tax=Crotalaria pallida TaxID=3830 RepID=A0AAN9I591_CROPI
MFASKLLIFILVLLSLSLSLSVSLSLSFESAHTLSLLPQSSLHFLLTLILLYLCAYFHFKLLTSPLRFPLLDHSE